MSKKTKLIFFLLVTFVLPELAQLAQSRLVGQTINETLSQQEGLTSNEAVMARVLGKLEGEMGISLPSEWFKAISKVSSDDNIDAKAMKSSGSLRKGDKVNFRLKSGLEFTMDVPRFDENLIDFKWEGAKASIVGITMNDYHWLEFLIFTNHMPKERLIKFDFPPYRFVNRGPGNHQLRFAESKSKSEVLIMGTYSSSDFYFVRANYRTGKIVDSMYGRPRSDEQNGFKYYSFSNKKWILKATGGKKPPAVEPFGEPDRIK